MRLRRGSAWRTVGCGGALLVVAVCVSTPGQAQPDPRVEEAKARFLAAKQLEEAERWSEATRELKLALNLKETPGLRFHLGYCDERQGHYVEALASYRRARELIDDGHAADDVVELLGPALERVQSQIVVLEVDVESQPAGTEIRIDGRIAELGSAALNPGTHVIEVVAPGWKTYKRTLRLRQGRQRIPVLLARVPGALEEADEVEPAPVKAPRDPIPEETPSSATKTWVLIGESIVLGGAVAAGIGFALQAGREQERADLLRGSLSASHEDCTRPTGSHAEQCAELNDFTQGSADNRLYSTLAFVGAGMTATALALTALLWPDTPHTARAMPIVPVGPRSSWGISTRFAF